MRTLTAALARLDRWMCHAYATDAASLAVYRVLFSTYLILCILPAALWTCQLPQALFSPPLGLAALFTDFMPCSGILTVNALTSLCACALLVGYRTVAASIGVTLGLLVLKSFAYADGKIDHDILIVLMPLVLARSGWGERFSVSRSRERAVATPAEWRAWCLAVLALLIGMAIFTAGLAKLRGGWLNVHTRATRWHLLPNYYVMGRDALLTTLAVEHLPSYAWKLLDWVTLVWEAGLLFTVPSARLFRAGCALGACFHVGVLLLFGIDFSTNVVAYAAFIRWSQVAPGPRAALWDWAHRRADVVRGVVWIVPVCVSLWALFVAGADPDTWLGLQLSQAIVWAGPPVVFYLATRKRLAGSTDH